MLRAPPYVHFSCPGRVLRSFGHPGTTSYGPDTSSAPIAPGTALNEAGRAAVWAATGESMKRLSMIMPKARPTASVNTMVTLLFITPSVRGNLLQLCVCYHHAFPIA